MSDDLKRCPFCYTCVVNMIHTAAGTYYVTCERQDCLASGPMCYTHDDAVEKWNTRP